MSRMMIPCFVALSLLATPSIIDAQTLLYAPVSTPVVQEYVAMPAPVYVVQRPGIISRPAAVNQPGPAPPLVTGAPATVVARPVFGPVNTYTVAPGPVITYSPIVSAPATVPMAPRYIPVARPVVVRTKTYVRGQPIRNLLRAITP